MRQTGPDTFGDLSVVDLGYVFAESDFWGDSVLVMKPVPYHWDEMKIDPGAPPIRTEQG